MAFTACFCHVNIQSLLKFTFEYGLLVQFHSIQFIDMACQ